jgi:ATP-dependent helicase/nuclease subunit B
LWDIQVTTPQGVPLAALPFGRLICKLAQCLAQEVSVTSLLDVLHDPAVTLDPSLLAALRDACRGVLSALPLSQRIARLAVSSPACSELAVTIARMEQLSITSLPLSRWLEALAELQVALAPEISDGREAVRELLEAMSQHASADRLSPVDALEILALALQEPVRRPHPHAHPRVHILSPVEARLQRFDRVILAGFNEGEWTAPPTPDPWLNLAQKAALGLPPPGADTSLLALDVALLGMAPELFLTRARRGAGRPTAAARFLVRLETLCASMKAPATDAAWAYWRQEMRAVRYAPITPAMPNPPPSMRPRALDVSTLDDLFSDPYRIYASAVLGIRETRPFDQMPNAADFGTLAHKLIKKMLTESLDPDASGWVRHELQHLEGDARFTLLWLPRMRRLLQFVAEMSHMRGVKVESEFPLTHMLNNHPLTLKGRIDRLEELGQGAYSIHDYKTGPIPEIKEMKEGRVPQLIAYALMLEEIRGVWPQELCYWALPRGRYAGKITPHAFAEQGLAEHAAALKAALYRITEEKIPYLALSDTSPYAPLSRNEEWK